MAHDIGRWLEAEELARAGTGALLAVERAGAYGAAMASVYNGRPRPAEVVLEGGVARLSRRRETLEDLVSRDVRLAVGSALGRQPSAARSRNPWPPITRQPTPSCSRW